MSHEKHIEMYVSPLKSVPVGSSILLLKKRDRGGQFVLFLWYISWQFGAMTPGASDPKVLTQSVHSESFSELAGFSTSTGMIVLPEGGSWDVAAQSPQQWQWIWFCLGWLYVIVVFCMGEWIDFRGILPRHCTEYLPYTLTPETTPMYVNMTVPWSVLFVCGSIGKMMEDVFLYVEQSPWVTRVECMFQITHRAGRDFMGGTRWAGEDQTWSNRRNCAFRSCLI